MPSTSDDSSQDPSLRYAGVMRLLFLIGRLNLIGMWFGEDQRANIIKTHVSKRLDCVFKY